MSEEEKNLKEQDLPPEELITTFVNDTEGHPEIIGGFKFRIPLKNSRLELVIDPGQSTNYKNDGPEDFYARYSKITAKPCAENKWKYKVELTLRPNFEVPKHGLILDVIVESDENTVESFKIGDTLIGVPAFVPIRIFDIDPRDFFAEFSEFRIVKPQIVIMPDPYSKSGTRPVKNMGGTVRYKRRTKAELAEIEQTRIQARDHRLTWEKDKEKASENK